MNLWPREYLWRLGRLQLDQGVIRLLRVWYFIVFEKVCHGCKHFLLRAEKTLPWPISALWILLRWSEEMCKNLLKLQIRKFHLWVWSICQMNLWPREYLWRFGRLQPDQGVIRLLRVWYFYCVWESLVGANIFCSEQKRPFLGPLALPGFYWVDMKKCAKIYRNYKFISFICGFGQSVRCTCGLEHIYGAWVGCSSTKGLFDCSECGC